MKASDIYELVREWPKAAWPKGVTGFLEHYVEIDVVAQGDRACCEHGHIFPDRAALLFEASGMRWLMERYDENDGVVITAHRSGEGAGMGFSVLIDRRPATYWHGPTLLHALSAAILAVAHNPETPGAAR